MGAYSRTYSLTDGTTAYGSQVAFELDALGSSVNNIVNAQIASGAAIADSKLAQITTASKVSGAALTSLGSIPSGAGTIPSINLGSAGVLGSYKNLKVVRDSATQVTVTADEIMLEDSSNGKAVIRTLNKSAAITTSGAGGLDTGAEASNTIYYIWVIRKSSDGTTNALLSTSSSSPTMPSGYDQKALVGCVGNDNSSNFIDFYQYGRDYFFASWPTVASGNVGIGSWTSIDLTPATLSFFVPPALSTHCFGSFYHATGTNVVGVTNDSSKTVGDADATNKFYVVGSTSGLFSWELDVITADTIYWMSDNAGSKLYLHGFRINKMV